MKRRLQNTFLLLGAVVALSGGDVFAKDVKMWMDFGHLSVPHRFIVKDGHVLVPLRAVCEKLGYDVSWDEEARQVRLKKDFKDIVYNIDKNGIVVNNIKKSVEIAPKIIDDRTYISEEAFSKGLTDSIYWDESSGVTSIEIDGSYKESNWLEIVDLKKSYTKLDENGKEQARIDITVPQVVNYDNNLAIEKINDYYRDKASALYDEYTKLMEDDLAYRIGKDEVYEYYFSYAVLQNSSNILSVIGMGDNKGVSFGCDCDVFDVTTGEKLDVYDVLEGTKEEIDKMVVDGIKKAIKETPIEGIKEKDISLDSIKFGMEKGNVIFVINNYEERVRFRIDLKDNKKLFKIRAGNPFNYDEEIAAKKVAMDSYGKDMRFVDKTTLGTDECYVFEKRDNSSDYRIAVSRSGEKVYKLKKKNGMYYAMSKKRKKDEVSDRDAVKLVRDRIGNDEYMTKVYGNMKDNSDGQEYSVINVENLDRTVRRKFAVSRKDGSVYVEKKKVTPTLKTNDDGTVSAVGFFEIDAAKTNEETSIENWGSGFRTTHESYMLIREDGTGSYNIGVSAEDEEFRLVNEDGKTYIEITNEEGKEALPKGTRFLVEVKEVDGVPYLYVHDELGEDAKPGNKYWKLFLDNRSRYIDKDMVTPQLKKDDDGTVLAGGCFRINNEVTSKETDTKAWGSEYLESGSCMMIGNDRTGTYNVGLSKNIEHFELVNEGGKTYIEITNEEDKDALPKGTRFLVEIKEVDGVSYLYMHDEEGKDVKPGNKYWELDEEGAIKFEPYGYSNRI